ncbi:ABC transporter ATP-binding protein [Albimonas pacifica]|uniref:Putative spermidine/putrescine transport system ATP-binding protein/spermidine/putrescine transport system ATP-binding protein n=1 Tax=Albimonas pacifica TaxID=1114924 RepID=A0A1I3CKD3_9RHOB|nr:ABC transporter ATP-binding protein [Albimonas pacifica]SFH74985.1 putative spermidine/putrescine transport system ATP-binding protein/spermidine/putrescine transport system ATP-binding protein [Albimonas pacifica]
MLELQGLSKRYGTEVALDDVSLVVRDDEYLTLLGPSGSGKSTLLRVIAGLETPDAGRVLLDGRDIGALPTHRRGLGIVQQNYALFPHMTVFDNVAFGLRFRETAPVADPSEVDRRTRATLDLVGLTGFETRMPGQLSGGQKQRVSLARTLVTEPRICLLDEPLGALDANLRERMTVELRRIREALGVTFLHVTGNEAEALAMGDRMIVLDRGRALAVAPPEEIFAAPADTRVARFLNAWNLIPGRAGADGFEVAGEAPLALPAPAPQAQTYGVPYDAAWISRDPAPAPGEGVLPARYVASEFLGSKVVYLLRRADGKVFEVERHLSREDPETYAQDETLAVRWRLADVHLFDGAGRRIPLAPAGAPA